MLLLEPGEIFFEDYSVQMRKLEAPFSEDERWMDGRLKLCSKSLVFVNKDINQPLIKIQLKETTLIKQCTLNNDTVRQVYFDYEKQQTKKNRVENRLSNPLYFDIITIGYSFELIAVICCR